MNDRVALSAVMLLFGMLFAGVTTAQDKAEIEDPAHEKIRAMRDGALSAYRAKDISKLLTFLHPNVAITIQNAEVFRGHDAVRKFHERMSVGENREVVNIVSEFDVDDLSILYGGDTAIAIGSMDDVIELKRGLKFTLHSRWTATMVKEDGSWLVAALHVSTNMFDNGVSKLLLWWNTVKVGAIGGALGLVVGGLAVAYLRGKRQGITKT